MASATRRVALRHLAAFFKIPFHASPPPDDPISILREEFDAAYDRLAAAGLPLKPDRDQCLRDFAGWRVNYDEVLRRFASLCMAPPALWSGDRPITFRRLPVTRSRARARLP